MCTINSKKILFSMVIAFLITLVALNPVYADDGTENQPTPTPIIIRQGDPDVAETSVSTTKGTLQVAATTAIRRGSTDAWWVYYLVPLRYEHHGSHTSQSDLVEDKIWVDGSLKVGAAGTVDSCSKHSAGQYSNCGTAVTYNWKYKIVATSYHFFQKTGYVDTKLTTSKTMTP